jgi:hypothetical protein
MKNPGIIVKRDDGSRVIVYNDQPLLAERGRIILHLVDENNKKILNGDGKPKIRIMDVQVYNEEIQASTLIGYVD